MSSLDEYDLIYAEVYAADINGTPKDTAENALTDFEASNVRGDAALFVWVKAYAAKIRIGGTRVQAGASATTAVQDHAASMSSLFDRRT